jgi:hypothetical protein
MTKDDLHPQLELPLELAPAMAALSDYFVAACRRLIEDKRTDPYIGKSLGAVTVTPEDGQNVSPGAPGFVLKITYTGVAGAPLIPCLDLRVKETSQFKTTESYSFVGENTPDGPRAQLYVGVQTQINVDNNLSEQDNFSGSLSLNLRTAWAELSDLPNVLENVLAPVEKAILPTVLRAALAHERQ